MDRQSQYVPLFLGFLQCTIVQSFGLFFLRAFHESVISYVAWAVHEMVSLLLHAVGDHSDQIHIGDV